MMEMMMKKDADRRWTTELIVRKLTEADGVNRRWLWLSLNLGDISLLLNDFLSAGVAHSKLTLYLNSKWSIPRMEQNCKQHVEIMTVNQRFIFID